MLNDTILSIKKDCKKLIHKYQMDFENWQLEVVLRTATDDTNDVFIDITYSNERGVIKAKSTGHLYPNKALNEFETSISLEAAKMNSVHGLTL